MDVLSRRLPLRARGVTIREGARHSTFILGRCSSVAERDTRNIEVESSILSCGTKIPRHHTEEWRSLA